MGAANNNSVRRRVRLWAVSAVIVDLLVLVGLISIGHITDSQARSWVSVWVMLHEPALTFAAAVLPGLREAHGHLSLTSYQAFGFRALGQTAGIGGLLGWIYLSSRKRGAS